MNYSTAMRRYEAGSIVLYDGKHWHIQGLDRPAGTAMLLLDGKYHTTEAPLKEITE